MIKRLAAKTLGSPVFGSLVGLLERLTGDQPQSLRVLTYHRVDDPARRPELYPGLISATPAGFEEQVRYLAAHCRVVGLPELIEAARSGRPLPPRAVLITFDDAYRDFAECAWPILRRYGLPATLFVPTAYPGHPERAFWWDRLHEILAGSRAPRLDTPVGTLALASPAGRGQAYRRLRAYVKSLPHREAMRFVDELCAGLGAPPARGHVLGWDELRGLAREGVALAAHTRTHPLLSRVSLEEVRDEAAGSRRDLEREIGAVPPAFAYPSGSFTNDVVRALGEEGFEVAFTTEAGVNDLRRPHWLRLRRLNVTLNTSLPLLRARMLGGPGLLSPAQRSV